MIAGGDEDRVVGQPVQLENREGVWVGDGQDGFLFITYC